MYEWSRLYLASHKYLRTYNGRSTILTQAHHAGYTVVCGIHSSVHMLSKLKGVAYLSATYMAMSIGEAIDAITFEQNGFSKINKSET